DLVDSYFIIPKVNQNNYWDEIHRIIKEQNIDIAFVQPEAEVTAWGEYKNEHGNFPCPVLIPPLPHVNVLMNKANMAELLKNTSYIPKTIVIRQGSDDGNSIKEEIGYPCWIRASVGSG